MIKDIIAHHQNETSLMRLDRLLVHRAIASRKEVQKLIRRGFVTHQDEVLKDPKLKVKSNIELYVDGQLSEVTPLLLAFHKPLDMLCTLKDPWGRKGLDHVLPTNFSSLFHPVGRLDADTSGLLLFCSDGQVTQRLLHPKYRTPRTYWALIENYPSDLSDRLTQGVETSLGTFQAELLDHVSRDQSQTWLQAHHYWHDQHSHHENRYHFPVHWLNPVQAELTENLTHASHCVLVRVYEGKNRMVRRMLHNAGASVLALHRISFADIQLNQLAEGELKTLVI